MLPFRRLILLLIFTAKYTFWKSPRSFLATLFSRAFGCVLHIVRSVWHDVLRYTPFHQRRKCFVGLGRIALLLGDTPTAEKYFSRSATNENAEHNTLVHNGLIALSGGDYAVAADTFKQAWYDFRGCLDNGIFTTRFCCTRFPL